MKNKNVVPVWVSVVLLALCALCVVGLVFLLVNDRTAFTAPSAMLFLCAVVMAVIYCFMGYKKNAAKFFMIFSIVLALALLLQIAHYYTVASNRVDPVGFETTMQAPPEGEAPSPNFIGLVKSSAKIILPTLIFGIMSILSVAKDLGKKKSYYLAGSSVVLSMINYLTGSILIYNGAIDVGIINASGREFTIFTLCVIYGIMVYAKYQDKTARGTK